MTVCVIPARGGSKRIPRKNIKLFHNKELIAYSIERALESRLFSRVIVSTDDSEIAEIARRAGAETPFERPAELADDYANTFDLLQHAADWVHKYEPESKFMCCLYATAPFIKVTDLVAGFELLNTHPDLSYVYSITEFPFPTQRCIRKIGQRVEPCFPEHMYKRSQDLEQMYHDAGQFYWGTVEAFLTKAEFFGEHSAAVELPRYRVVDIDTNEDWDVAEIQYEILLKAGKLS